jgi:succinoglycan biosynthesis transport protein ExoP
VTEHTSATASPDEPDLLREQVGQLLRYRALLLAGLAVGLLVSGLLAFVGSDTYVATAEVMVRSPTVDPFAAGGVAADKQINIGTERQTAASSAVASRAVAALGKPGELSALQSHVQVDNPANTLVLRFAFTADTSKGAARGATAFSQAYLDYRRQQTENLIKNMVAGYRSQLDPLARQREQLLDQIETIRDDAAKSTVLATQADLLGRITELSNDISELRSLDTTPGYVIRTATPPASPEGLGLPMLLALGAGIGLALGLLAAWTRLVFDPFARCEGDVVRALRAPVLGALPRMRPGPLLATDHPDARLAERYRSIAFRLAYDRRFAGRRRLLVAAPRGAGDSAAAVAVNLSASFAETGTAALLVEADLRSPGLADRLRTAAGPRPACAGAAAPGEGGWPGELRVCVDAGESGTFDLVPGQRVRNVARALTSPAATRLVAEADAPGSTVVVLAPPVLSYADALALVDRVDGVVVVCDPAGVRRAELDRVRELIDGAGGAVLGSVLHSAPRLGPRDRLRGPSRRRTDRTDRAAGTNGPGGGTAAVPPRSPAGAVGAAEGQKPSQARQEPSGGHDTESTLTLVARSGRGPL